MLSSTIIPNAWHIFNSFQIVFSIDVDMDFKISRPDLLFSYVILLLKSEGKRLGASRARPRFARLESFERGI